MGTQVALVRVTIYEFSGHEVALIITMGQLSKENQHRRTKKT